MSLKLGGKSAAIILDDADIGDTVEALRYRSFPNNGQVRLAQTRVLISRKRDNQLVDRLVDNVQRMKIGDPADEATFLGPLVAERQSKRVSDYIEYGLESGADLAVAGLGMPDGINHGTFVNPTVFANVDSRSRIAQEEIFGPVVCGIPYDGVDEAVRIANDSTYGLSGSVRERSGHRPSHSHWRVDDQQRGA